MSKFFPAKYKKICRALEKLGLDLKEGTKHTKAECIYNGRKTTIPRHSKVKREIVKNIINFLLEKRVEKEDRIIELFK